MRLEKVWFVLDDDDTVLDTCESQSEAAEVMRRLRQAREEVESE